MMRTAVRSGELADALRPRLNALVLLLRRESAGGLTASQTALLHLLRDGRPRRMAELAAAQGVTAATASVVVRRLVDAGWVRRTGTEGDRRVVQVAITPAGAAVLDEVAARRVAALARRLDQLDDDDRAAIAAALPALDHLVAAEPTFEE